MGKIACYMVSVISCILFFVSIYLFLRKGNQNKIATKEFILGKIEYLYKNIDTFSKMKLFCKLIELRGLLKHRKRLCSTVTKNSLGLRIRVINQDEFPRKWQECLDYLKSIFDRRENGPSRNIDLQTMKFIAKDAYEFLKN